VRLEPKLAADLKPVLLAELTAAFAELLTPIYCAAGSGGLAVR
jgi:hypothetical protein